MAKLIVLFVTAFVDMVGLVMVLPLLPFYATSFGAGAATIGILVSIFSLSQMACAPLWGRFSDNYGRRPAILLGLCVTSVAYVLFGLADSIWVLLLSRAVQGIGGGTIGVIQAYVADTCSPSQRTKSLGWLSAVTSLGAVVGPAFGSLLVTTGGRRAPGFAAAALAALVAGFAWKYLQESKSPALSVKKQTTPSVSSTRVIFKVLTDWSDPAARLIWIYAIGIGAFYGTVPTMPLLLAERLGITEHTVGYVIMYMGAMGVLLRSFFLSRWVDRYGDQALSRAGLVFLAAGLAALGATQTFFMLAVSLTLMPLGTACLFPSVSGQLSNTGSSEDRGLYLGVQQAFGGASRVVFPIGVGIAMDSVGFGIPFFVAALLVLFALPLTRSEHRVVVTEEITVGGA
jgi:multidrug resistance protein